MLVLDALGIGPGDEVICPAFTFYATAESMRAAAQRRSSPTSIPPRTTSTPRTSRARITPRTRAIMPVHLFGRPAPLDELAAFDLPLIEDAAQAFGAPGIAQQGIASTFSFYPTKNLFALGDGGLVAVNDEELGERLRLLRFHGSKAKVRFELRRLQLAPRRDPRRGVAHLPAAPGRVDGAAS